MNLRDNYMMIYDFFHSTFQRKKMPLFLFIAMTLFHFLFIIPILNDEYYYYCFQFDCCIHVHLIKGEKERRVKKYAWQQYSGMKTECFDCKECAHKVYPNEYGKLWSGASINIVYVSTSVSGFVCEYVSLC